MSSSINRVPDDVFCGGIVPYLNFSNMNTIKVVSKDFKKMLNNETIKGALIIQFPDLSQEKYSSLFNQIFSRKKYFKDIELIIKTLLNKEPEIKINLTEIFAAIAEERSCFEAISRRWIPLQTPQIRSLLTNSELIQIPQIRLENGNIALASRPGIGVLFCRNRYSLNN